MLLRRANSVLHLGVFALLAGISSYSIGQLTLIAACMLVCWAATHLALSPKITAAAPQKTGLVIAVVALYWIGYLTKFGLSMYLAEQFWVVPKLIHARALIAGLPQAYLITTIGYVSVLAGIFIMPSGRDQTSGLREFQARYWLVTNLIILTLLVKIFLKVTYSLAIPSVLPTEMSIPYLTGILSLVIDTGVLFPANIPFIIGLTRGRKSWAVLGFTIALVNAGIDLAFGAKDTMIYQIIIFALLLFFAFRNFRYISPQAQSLVRLSFRIVFVAGLLVVFIYPLGNPFRYARLAGNDILTSIQIAWVNGPINSQSPLMAIYNRITGIEVLTSLIHTRNYLQDTSVIQSLFSTDLVSNITNQFLGAEQDTTRFSVTQIGYFYVTGGYPVLIIGCLLVGAFFSLVQEMALRSPVERVLKFAFLPVLWILAAKLLLGGGNLFLTAKELSVVLIMFIVWSLIACGYPARLKTSGVASNGRRRLRHPLN